VGRCVKGVTPVDKAAELDAEHRLFILYTSGSTGKPKGVLHTTGGYMTQAYITTKWVFDLATTDIYWCTADVGWVTGHSYIVYGPLSNGATVVMYEGAPNTPARPLLGHHRALQGHDALHGADGDPHVHALGRRASRKARLSSLRLLGTVGEPINPEAWMWYRRVIGGERCPIVDTWWQTETGGIMITPMPGAVATKPGSARCRSRHGHRRSSTPTASPSARTRRAARDPAAVARHAAHDLGRRRALQARLLVALPGMYFAGDGARRDRTATSGSWGASTT
jgi:acyl-coenzyme A synthetase/AMP-(fatty) acid ligase